MNIQNIRIFLLGFLKQYFGKYFQETYLTKFQDIDSKVKAIGGTAYNFQKSLSLNYSIRTILNPSKEDIQTLLTEIDKNTIVLAIHSEEDSNKYFSGSMNIIDEKVFILDIPV